MAENSADFYLRLHEQVNAPARRAEAAVRRLSGGLVTSRQELNRTEAALRRHFALQQKGPGKQKDGSGLVGQIAIGSMIGDLGASAVRAAARAVVDLGSSFVSATAHALDFGQRSRLAFSSLIGDASRGKQEFDFVRADAQRLGLDIEDTTEQYRKLLAAQFSIGQARDILRATADMQALGASATDIQGIFLAISQIKMKGILQAEELTKQLANAGVSTELVYQALEKRLGKTRKEVLAMQKAKQITADIAVPAILEAIKGKAHEENLGDVALKFANTKISGMVAQMKGALKNALIDIGTSLEQPATTFVQALFGDFQRDLPIIANTMKVVADEMFLLLTAGANQANKDIGGLGGAAIFVGEAFFFAEDAVRALFYAFSPLKIVLAGIESIAYALQGDFDMAGKAAKAFFTGRSDVSRWNIATEEERISERLDLEARVEKLKSGRNAGSTMTWNVARQEFEYKRKDDGLSPTSAGLENRHPVNAAGNTGGKVINIGTLNQTTNVEAVDHNGKPEDAGDQVGKAALKQFIGALENA